LTGLVMLAAGLGRPPSPALAADGVVDTGASASCTEAAFDTVLSTVQGSGGGAITFNCGAAAHTITFTAEKSITVGVTINGAGQITLSGTDTTSLFLVNFGGALTLRGLIVTRAGGASGAVTNLARLTIIDSQLINNAATNGSGGAIWSIGTAALTNALIFSNTASQNGGGLYNGGIMTISGGLIAGNQATTTGGGLHNAGTMTIPGGLISSNLARDEGGGIYTTDPLSMTNASLTNNSAGRGGGAVFGVDAGTRISLSVVQANSSRFGGGLGHYRGELTLDQVLVANNGSNDDAAGNADSGGGVYLVGPGVFNLTRVTSWQNSARRGGGIYQAGGSLTLLNSTVSENRGRLGGGLYLEGGSTSIRQTTITDNTVDYDDPSTTSGAGVHYVALSGSSLVLAGTILTGNHLLDTRTAANCGGALPTASFSLSSDGTCSFGLGRNNIALPLGPLQNNGGFTPTHLLPQGSSAIDAGTNAGCPATDQRGLSRPVGAACDVGAIEARASDFIQQVFLPTLQT
jgi:hypothetical protein